MVLEGVGGVLRLYCLRDVGALAEVHDQFICVIFGWKLGEASLHFIVILIDVKEKKTILLK